MEKLKDLQLISVKSTKNLPVNDKFSFFDTQGLPHKKNIQATLSNAKSQSKIQQLTKSPNPIDFNSTKNIPINKQANMIYHANKKSCDLNNFGELQK